jgi:hypothetical protein
MTNFKILNLETSSTVQPQPRNNCSHQCSLQWRQGQLLVRQSEFDLKHPYLPSLESEEWLAKCLQHSPVRLVRLDSTLGEAALRRWADACEQANKPVFLRGSVAQKLSTKPSQFNRWIMQRLDWILALLLLLVLSPVMLAVGVLLSLYLPNAIFSKQWHVGTRGKLFRAIKFSSSTTPLGHWLCKYSLDELPVLFNVLRGEMSLIGGPRPLNLYDAVQLNPEVMTLNVLPRFSRWSSSL